jgi:hypothetical protein
MVIGMAIKRNAKRMEPGCAKETNNVVPIPMASRITMTTLVTIDDSETFPLKRYIGTASSKTATTNPRSIAMIGTVELENCICEKDTLRDLNSIYRLG